MKHMINIFLFTVLALVVIAAGVQLCRPKDHGRNEIPFTTGKIRFTEHGIVTDWYGSPLMEAFYQDLAERTGSSKAALSVIQTGNGVFVGQQLTDRQIFTKFDANQLEKDGLNGYYKRKPHKPKL